MNLPSELAAVRDRVHNLFLARGLTLGLAESCTGGQLAAFLTERSGASGFFQGSVVSYSGRVKASVLAVPKPLMRTHGEVSLPVARAMANGARAALGCDWAVSITGIAGPGGGSPDKPVGTVCFAVVGPGFEAVEQKLFSGRDRAGVQLASAQFALEFLWQSIHS